MEYCEEGLYYNQQIRGPDHAVGLNHSFIHILGEYMQI